VPARHFQIARDLARRWRGRPDRGEEDLYRWRDIEIDAGRNDVRAAGGRVTLAGSRSPCHATIAAGRAIVEAKIAGDLKWRAARTAQRFLQGNVTVRAGELDIGPATRVAGRLQYETTGSPSIDPAAQIAGGLEANRSAGMAAGSAPVRRRGPRWFGIFVVGSIMILASPGSATPARSLEVSRGARSAGASCASSHTDSRSSCARSRFIGLRWRCLAAAFLLLLLASGERVVR